MSTRFRICLAVWVVTIVCSAFCSSSRAEAFEVTSDWAIEISPAYRGHAAVTTASNPALTIPSADSDDGTAPHESPVVVLPANCNAPGDEYRRIYDSIPFNRAEYNVNPSYRHDSTMELLTGNARHQTIVRHNNRPKRTRRIYYYNPVLPFQSSSRYRNFNPNRGFNQHLYPLRPYYWLY